MHAVVNPYIVHWFCCKTSQLFSDRNSAVVESCMSAFALAGREKQNLMNLTKN